MPIYEYWCPNCRTSFEKMRAMQSNDSDLSCPKCGSLVKRMVSLFAVSVTGRRSGSDARAYSSGGGCACGGNCGCGHRHN